jgi:phage-related protein
LQDGIFELRTSLLATIARTLYFHVQGNKFILTNGFIKKTQETPRKEIEKALRYRNEYYDLLEEGRIDP